MTRWISKSPASDITTDALIERVKDDCAYLASGHVPRSADDARGVGLEMMELISRIETLVASIPEGSAMAQRDREWRNDRQTNHSTGPVEWKADPSKRP